MKNIHVVVAPLFKRDSNRSTTQFLQNLFLFCSWSGARLRVLSERPDLDETHELLVEQRECSSCESVEFTAEGASPSDMLNIVKQLSESSGPEVLGICLEKSFLGKPIMNREKAAVFLEANLPTLVLPASLSFRYPPIESVLVAMAGERKQSEALRIAISIGTESGVPVDLLHVTGKANAEDASVLGDIADEFQHEYPRRVEEFITEASPFSSDKEKLCIRNFCHLRGDVSSRIRDEMAGESARLLLMEWKGNLRYGRAEVLRSVLRYADFPVLLVRPEVQGQARLRIGKDFPLAG